MVAITAIKPGDMLWDCRMQKQGNTTIRKMACWQVKVIEVQLAPVPKALVSWNMNAPKWIYEANVNKLRRTKVEK